MWRFGKYIKPCHIAKVENFSIGLDSDLQHKNKLFPDVCLVWSCYSSSPASRGREADRQRRQRETTRRQGGGRIFNLQIKFEATH